MSELIKLDEKQLLDYFMKEGGLIPLLDEVKRRVKDFPLDLTTKAGIAKVKSNVTLIVKSKKILDEARKGLTEEHRIIVSTINDEWKRGEKFLDDLKKDYRKPLTEFEDSEKVRIAEMERKITYICDLKNIDSSCTVDEISANIKIANEFDVNEDDFPDEANFKAYKVKDQALKALNVKLDARIKFDTDQLELKALRDKQTEIDNEKSRLKKIQDDLEAKTNAEKSEAEKKELAKNNEIKRISDEKKKAEDDKAQAEENARQSKLKADSLQKQLDDQAKAKEDQEKRDNEAKERATTNERENKRLVHNVILNQMKEIGLDEDTAKKIIVAIGTGLITNIKIDYANIPKDSSFVESNSTKVEQPEPARHRNVSDLSFSLKGA